MQTFKRELQSSESKWPEIRSLDIDFVYLLPQIDFLGFLGKCKAVEENRKAVEENQKAFAGSRKALRKVERHCGKQKAIDKSRIVIEETWRAIEKTRKAVAENQFTSEENWILSKENWILGQENLDFPKTISSFWRFWGLVLTPDLLPRAHMDLLDWSQLLTI